MILIAVFYLFTAWLTVGAVGAADARHQAAIKGGAFMIDLTGRFAGPVIMAAMGLLVCTSLLASYLALHNAAARYIFALSREKLLPTVFGELHPARYAPSNASLAVSLLTLAGIAAFGVTRLDPYLNLIPPLIGLGTFGIILIQAMAALAILTYFWRRRSIGLWKVISAAAAGAVGLVIAAVLVGQNFGVLAASALPWTAWLPWSYALTVICGLGFAAWMRRARPKDYAGLAETYLRADSERTIPEATFDGRYCIVGGGPCGLLTARAFKLAGVPYDQFERHSDVGGIWDINNPGSSMYESAHSAHFISSKYTSNFFGAPMPEDYPDYPSYRQILDYIRQFAVRFGLRDNITFGVEVQRATPIGSNAERRLACGVVEWRNARLQGPRRRQRRDVASKSSGLPGSVDLQGGGASCSELSRFGGVYRQACVDCGRGEILA